MATETTPLDLPFVLLMRDTLMAQGDGVFISRDPRLKARLEQMQDAREIKTLVAAMEEIPNDGTVAGYSSAVVSACFGLPASLVFEGHWAD